ncbi:N-formylglutamate amidohydrolase [Sandaracinobacteroides hominis]|uniref:N-formylglutamate amidohydrolase n=1 Tax=Sandaracinobacteroides hominis TaxID=2780086 RepID=UPI0018F40AD7|nr:N-formylglutamate amidohydrolase [Sandaracinobacteroides hominis]
MRPYSLTGSLNGQSPILLASPHSGTVLPPDFLSTVRLPIPALRRMEDAHVGSLLQPAAALGVPLIEATVSRAVLDLNRAEDELDPQMFAGPLGIAPRHTDRVRRGHGLIPRVVAANQPIHAQRIPARIAGDRILALHRPWHQALAQGLEAAREVHGHALLLDIHSMPSLEGNPPAQLVLGDLHGRSAAPPIVDWLEAQFRAAGLKVARNSPYAGGFTTERHGRPAEGLHAVQIEFDRALYMDVSTLKPHRGFMALSAMIADVLGSLRPALARLAGPTHFPLAAE